jgi:CDP-diacylglycerol---glycerol-3-phosphate 3-phosphatidyltransferase
MSVVPASFRQRVRSTIETPVARFFGRLGFSPNALTLIGFGIAIVGAYFAAMQDWLTAGLVVAFGAVFDLFDGALARATGKSSKFGAFMDSTFDRAGEAVVFVGIVVGLVAAEFKLGVTLAASAMAASFMVSYVRARSESLGFSPGTGMASVGLAPREVRMVILVVGLLAAGLLARSVIGDCPAGVPCPQMWQYALVAALGLITFLATVTTIQRILFTYNQSRSQNQEVNK